MEVTAQRIGSAVVVDLEGQLTFNANVTKLMQTLWRLMQGRAVPLVIDLGNVTRIDARGIGVLIQLRNDAERAGIKLGLANLGRRHRELLELTQVLPYFEIYDLRDEVLACTGTDAARATRSWSLIRVPARRAAAAKRMSRMVMGLTSLPERV